MQGSTATSNNDVVQRLLVAVAAGDPAALRAALPEPPYLLPLVLSLDTASRNTVLVALLAALDTEEDQWEIIEATAMDSIARPEREAFGAVALYIPAGLLQDAAKLVSHFPDPETVRNARVMLDRQAAALGVMLNW